MEFCVPANILAAGECICECRVALTHQCCHLSLHEGKFNIDCWDQRWHQRKELSKQLKLARSVPQINGNVFFSAKSLPQHQDVVKKIHKTFYQNPVPLPNMISKPNRILDNPVVVSKKNTGGISEICLSHYDSIPRYILVYANVTNKRRPRKLLKKVYLPSNTSSTCFQLSGKTKNVGFKVRDAFGNESEMNTTTY